MTGQAGRFGSVVTAMVTPFREDDHAVDLDGARQLASWLVDNGSDAIVVAGSTGESPTLSAKEKAELFRAVGEAIHGRGKLICGTGTYSTAETLELTEAAEEAGADGLLVVTLLQQAAAAGLIAHFERVADATDLPIIAYTGTAAAIRIEHDTLLTLAERPNIVAVKDSTGDFQAVSRLIAEAPAGFEVYSGDDWAAFGYACLGAVGVVSVRATSWARRSTRCSSSWARGTCPPPEDPRALTAVQRAVHHVEPDPVKAALNMLGRPAGVPRLPLVPATSEEQARVRSALGDAGLL